MWLYLPEGSGLRPPAKRGATPSIPSATVDRNLCLSKKTSGGVTRFETIEAQRLSITVLLDGESWRKAERQLCEVILDRAPKSGPEVEKGSPLHQLSRLPQVVEYLHVRIDAEGIVDGRQ